MDFERGIIEFFDSRRRYGFICTDGGVMIFFHVFDCRDMHVKDEEIVFSDQHPRMEPVAGCDVVFTRERNAKGFIAKPWAFASAYDMAQKLLDQMPMYRVMKHLTVNGRLCEPFEVWRGKSVKALALAYPRKEGGDDALAAFSSKDFAERYVFQKKDPDSDWREWVDPRPIEPLAITSRLVKARRAGRWGDRVAVW